MELTELERRALRRLAKQDRQWRWFRFVSLFLSVGIIAVGLWQIRATERSLMSTTRNMSGSESPTGLEVYFASICGGQAAIANLLPAFGGILLGLTIARWRGNPVHTLLIGLASRVSAPHPE